MIHQKYKNTMNFWTDLGRNKRTIYNKLIVDTKAKYRI